MAPLSRAGSERHSCWSRFRSTARGCGCGGFNQSALVARELSRRLRIRSRPVALTRTRATPPLKGMSPLAAAQGRGGSLRGPRQQAVQGKTVILIDDVLTTGSTAEACARTLQRAGAERVELIAWARVVRPSQLMR